MNKEDYKKIEELFHKMSEHDKNILKEFLLSHQEEFKADPVETVRKGLYNSLIDDGRVQEEMLQQKREAMYIDEETKTVEPTPVNIFVDNNYIKKEPYLNGIEIGNAGDNIISEKDPHTKLLEELKSKFASMSYTDLYEFVNKTSSAPPFESAYLDSAISLVRATANAIPFFRTSSYLP